MQTITLTFLAVCALFLLSGCEADSGSTVTTSTVSGGAWVSMAAGNSQILRGLDIYLLNATDALAVLDAYIAWAEEWFDSCKQGMAERVPDIEPSLREAGCAEPLFILSTGISVMDREASARAIRVTRTDIEGKYRFDNVPLVEGNVYFIHAGHSTDNYAIQWLQYFMPTSGEPIQINLENSNARQIENKADSPYYQLLNQFGIEDPYR